MAAFSDSDDDESFVTLGAPLEVPDKDEPIRKPVPLQDLQAKDKKGRARFHGAFTGGFSAGFFNSVGSKEGFTPSTFVSSRSQKADVSQQQMPEDFMDEEDVEEFGIAPRKLVTASTFTSEERKRRRQEEATMATSDSILPGESALLDLIVPERLTIGVKLLRKMGWKDGQGVGPRLSRKQKRKQNAGQRIYGCEMPPSPDSSDDLDDATMLGDITFAPKDSAHIFLTAKDNTRGLGYRGLDPQKALPSSRGRSTGVGPTSKAGRRGIHGQAFGVGALEEDDDDIYSVDDMSRYDMTMGGEDEDDKFGWTAPRHRGSSVATPVGYVGQVLEGFKLSSTKLVQKKDFPAPQLPRHYRPVHVFSKSTAPADQVTATLTSGVPVGVDYRQFLKPADDQTPGTSGTSSESKSVRKPRQQQDSTSRSLALGEQAFVDVNECSKSNGGCQQRCINKVGSFYCGCNSGYTLTSNKKTCSDVNECSKSNGGCQQRCINKIGSFYCGCNSGYTLTSNKKTCSDINECSKSNGGCQQRCVNKAGSFYCSCNSGYLLQSNKKTCSDINECAGDHSCSQLCVNEPGSYKCDCKPGYKLGTDGQSCDDVDECTEAVSGCANFCRNTHGSYVCLCRLGFRLAKDGRSCLGR